MASSPTLLPLRPAPAEGPSAAADPRPEAEAFLVRVAELLHAHGTPAHRQERLMARMAEHLGTELQFLSTPTSLFLAFGSGEAQRVHLRRVQPGEVDLGRLIELDEVLEDLEDGRASLARSRARLEELAARGPRYGARTVALAFGAASAGAALLFGGGAAEAVASGAVGLVLGLLARLLPRRPEAAHVFEPLAAFVAAGLALVVARAVAPVSEGVVTLSGLIVLVPGLGVTVALIELASRHLVSGTARLAGALTVFLTIAFGVAMGRTLVGGVLPAVAPPVPVPAPGWALVLALALSPVAFAVLLSARRRELGVILVVSWIGAVGARLGVAALGPELGTFLAALFVGLASHVYARRWDRPASVPLTPAILLLVPGSVGYRALDLFLARDALAGLETAFQMALVATALVGGLLTANVALPPRRSL